MFVLSQVERFIPSHLLLGNAVRIESVSRLLSAITNNVQDTRVWLSYLHHHLTGEQVIALCPGGDRNLVL